MVHAGVDHEAGTPQGVVVESAEDGVRICIQPDLAGQRLAVERPALVEGREVEVAAEWRAAGDFEAECSLKVVARDRLVIGQGLHRVGGAAGRIGSVDEEDAGPRAVGGGGVVLARRRRLRPDRLEGPDLQRDPGQPAEEAREVCLHRGDDRTVAVEDLLVRPFLNRSSVRICAKNAFRSPSNFTCLRIASMASRVLAISARPIAWIWSGVRSVVV